MGIAKRMFEEEFLYCCDSNEYEVPYEDNDYQYFMASDWAFIEIENEDQWKEFLKQNETLPF